jgi:hypothetical protein
LIGATFSQRSPKRELIVPQQLHQIIGQLLHKTRTRRIAANIAKLPELMRKA